MSNRFVSILLGLLFAWVPVAFYYRAAEGALLPKELVALLVLVFFLFLILQEGRALGRLPLVQAALLFSVWMLGDSLVVSLSQTEAIKCSLHIFLMAGTFLVVVFVCARGFSYEKMVSLALWAGTALSIYGIFQSMGLDRTNWESHFDRRAFATLGNPDYFAGYLAALFPMAFLMTLRAKGRTSWLWYRLAMMVILVALLFTKVLGAILALAVALLVMLVIFLSRWGRERFRGEFRFILAVYGFLLIGAGAYFAWHGGMVAFQAKERSYQQRWDTYRVALEIAKDHPWTGIGLGQLGVQYPRYQAKPFVNDADPSRHPYTYTEHVHNEFLQFWVEGGIPGLAFFAALLLVYGVSVARFWKTSGWEGERDWMMGTVAAMIALLVQALTNFPLQIAPTAVLFGLYLAAPLALGPQAKGRALGVPRQGTKVTESQTGPGPLALRPTPAPAPLDFPRALSRKFLLAAILLAVGGWGSRMVASSIALRNTVGESSLGNGQLAVRYSERLVGLSPLDPKAWKAKAKALETAGKPEEAYQAYQKSLGLNPNDAEDLDEMAGLRIQQDRFEDALGLLDRALSITPNYPNLFLKKALSLFRLKRYAEAAREFQNLSVYEPLNPDVYANLGVCYIYLKQKEEAIAAWEKAYSLNSNDSQVIQYLKAQGVKVP